MEPFLVAAVRRSPVSLAGVKDLDLPAVLARIRALADESIYDGPARLAQPDEVWNYGRGDGAEKAILLANILRSREPDAELTLEISAAEAVLRTGRQTHVFKTAKGLRERTVRIPGLGSS